MNKTSTAIAATMIAATSICSASACGSTPKHHTLPPASDFVSTVDNPWFPLTPGTVLRSVGESDGIPASDVFRVTHRRKTIEGISATVIDDRVYMHGRLTERTTDWYAQDKRGNVWYLGEDTATLKADGSVESRDGTWRTGVNGGIAGIFMPAHPRAGQTGEQEYSPGQAQDRFKVLRFHVSVHTAGASSRNAMLVQETTPLEPGVVDHKVYVRGIGTVREQTVKGGDERFELSSVHRTKRP